jgi:hypothetical protein
MAYNIATLILREYILLYEKNLRISGAACLSPDEWK